MEGRQEDEWDVFPQLVFLHFAGKGKSVDAGHHDIGDDDVWLSLFQAIESFAGIVVGEYVVFVGKYFRHEPQHRWIIIYHHNGFAGSIVGLRCFIGRCSGFVGSLW